MVIGSQAAIEADGKISMKQAMALGSTNVEALLGGDVETDGRGDLVAVQGGTLLDMSSKVIAVISPRRSLVDLL